MENLNSFQESEEPIMAIIKDFLNTKKTKLIIIGEIAMMLATNVYAIPNRNNDISNVKIEHSQKPTEFNIRWISDQHVTGVNKEEGHASYIPYS